MVVAAGLLVLAGLGLLIGGLVSGAEGLYWACVAACGLAAVLLVVVRLQLAREARVVARRAPLTPAAPGTGPQPALAAQRDGEAPEPAGATAVRVPEPGWDDPPEPSAVAPLESPAAPAHAAPVADGHPEERPSRRGAHEPREAPVDAAGEPGEEDVEVTDLLLVVDLADEVLVVDEQPRYHLAGCRFLDGRPAVPLPMVEARTDGFTPCATCRPVRHLAGTERSRRQAARES